MRAGQLSAADIEALTMRSGYTGLNDANCALVGPAQQAMQTVSDCFLLNGNNAFDVNAVGHFFYNGGHFQKLAVDLGLRNDNNAALRADVQQQLDSYSEVKRTNGITTVGSMTTGGIVTNGSAKNIKKLHVLRFGSGLKLQLQRREVRYRA